MSSPRSGRLQPSKHAASGDIPLEATFFSAINRLTEPAVSAGFGSLWVLPAGLVVLEVTGRTSGEVRRVTLLAAEIDEYVVVSTLRVGRSQWLRNVRARPDVRYWIRGRPHDARAIATLPGEKHPPAEDERLRCVIESLERQSIAFGAAFVVLVPQ
jgi:deazaflavin-dependent oxidoreductase (nitroreductase family)